MRKRFVVLTVLAVALLAFGCGDLSRGNAASQLKQQMRSATSLGLDEDGDRISGYFRPDTLEVVSIEERSDTLRVAHFTVTQVWQDSGKPPTEHSDALAYFNLHDDGWHLKKIRVNKSPWGQWDVK